MKITADTNVLLRVLVNDDEKQAAQAVDVLGSANMVAISLQTLCEISWVLKVSYGATRANISAAIRALIDTSNVVTNRAAAEAGLVLLDAGGDFADGVIAFDGEWLGAEIFVSFDKKAVQLLQASGHQSQLLVT